MLLYEDTRYTTPYPKTISSHRTSTKKKASRLLSDIITTTYSTYSDNTKYPPPKWNQMKERSRSERVAIILRRLTTLDEYNFNNSSKYLSVVAPLSRTYDTVYTSVLYTTVISKHKWHSRRCPFRTTHLTNNCVPVWCTYIYVIHYHYNVHYNV